MKSGEKIVFDAWAILALILKEEPAAAIVKEILETANTDQSKIFISWINIGEVYYSIGKGEGLHAADEVLDAIQLLPLTMEVPSRADILDAARLKTMHRISYADAFAVSLTLKINGTICTGDPEIISLKKVVKVRPLSRKTKPV